ncbi:MAG: hypothetical protein ACREVL_08860, partial [Solimonas sp.]
MNNIELPHRGAWLRALCAGLLGLVTAAAQAAVPTTIHQAGRLFDTSSNADGVPVAGTQSVIFRLYGDPADATGAALWSETKTIAFDNGYFSVELGATTPFGDLLREQDGLWLGIQVGADAELQPRLKLASIPYALLAADVQGDIHPDSVTINGVKVIDASGAWIGAATGLTGPTGPAGPAGPAGARGPAGAAGPVGP